MREILCRGKRKDNGEWAYGYLYIRNDGQYEISFYSKYFDSERFTYDIIPETVGEYTNLTDKNDKKIFEGDIIKQINSYDKLEMTGFVRFSKSSQFVISHTYTEKENCYKRGMKKAFAIKTNCEIIGNIYDNPKLLEVEE